LLSLLLAWSAAAGFAVVGGLYVLYALAPTYYPPQVRAAGAGAAIAVGRLGSIAGPLIAGDLRAAGFSAGQVLETLIPAVLVAVAAIYALTTFARPHAD
jgi:AAHS family 3-hydroxyphenylpropionic acid transporter